MRLTISIVTYNNSDVIKAALDSIENSTLSPFEYDIAVVDNSSKDNTCEIIATHYPSVTLIHSANVGYGSAHNKAIRMFEYKAPYHLIMNPDIYFNKDVLEKLLTFMDQHPEVGLVMPQILYPDDKIQYLCKLLPTPFDLIARRFIPGILKPIFKKRFDMYEFRNRDYNQIMEVPHLSGCFMVIRKEVFETVGLFDQQFFMYLEDVDYSRRIHAEYKTLYYPRVSVYHQYHKGSYKRVRHLFYHIASAIKYFNKWGWFIDQERKKVNRR